MSCPLYDGRPITDASYQNHLVKGVSTNRRISTCGIVIAGGEPGDVLVNQGGGEGEWEPMSTVDVVPSWAETLAVDNISGGNDVEITSGDTVTGLGQIPVVSSQAAVDAIALTTSNVAGGITSTSGTGGLTSTTTGQISITTSQAAADAIALTASNVAGGITSTSGTGGSTSTSTGQISTTTSQAAADAIDLTASDPAGGIVVTAGTGNVTLNGHRRASRVAIATETLTHDLSGETLFLDASGGNFTLTLPAPKAGVFFRFIKNDTGGQIDIDSAGAASIIKGMIHWTIAIEGTPNLIGLAFIGAGTGEASVRFEGFSVDGDWCEVVSDGSRWFLHGMCIQPNAISFSVA